MGSLFSSPEDRAPAGTDISGIDTSEIGDFKALHERVHREAQEQKQQQQEASAPAATAGGGVRSDATEQGDIGSTGASDIDSGMDTSKMVAEAKEAASAVTSAVTGDSSATSETGAAGQGKGLLEGLAGIVAGIATKVNLASNSEEILAGGLQPEAVDEGSGAAVTGGVTDTSVAGDTGDNKGASVGQMAQDAADRVKDAAGAVGDKAARAAGKATGAVTEGKVSMGTWGGKVEELWEGGGFLGVRGGLEKFHGTSRMICSITHFDTTGWAID